MKFLFINLYDAVYAIEISEVIVHKKMRVTPMDNAGIETNHAGEFFIASVKFNADNVILLNDTFRNSDVCGDIKIASAPNGKLAITANKKYKGKKYTDKYEMETPLLITDIDGNSPFIISSETNNFDDLKLFMELKLTFEDLRDDLLF